ncbi:glycosyltransferase involved in cell wall biosynthesis [Humitalea rosea]|uniref:Glycosyltransferase involved in cell wall biosynthesis n=1 Tax=Humitalea rosea TaxID=990373 RepID=A0A2W7J717_9PROT|nr:glycosyltransferase family 4 protein [Humitalea rosea]PZW47086.1 glycosyltransferase involved in cell wall biosynthesis [Humitalea rosea]
MKIIEVANVDFALRHFVLPLMRGLRDRGHEVIGVAAGGPLLPEPDGFRVIALPMARSLNPWAQARAALALWRLFRAERPDLVHGHFPISGFLARIVARAAGVPRIAYTCHGFLFNQPGPLWRRWLSVAMEWLGGRVTDVFMTVSAEEAADARRLHIARDPIAIGNGRDPARFRPDAATRAAIRAEMGTAEATCVIIAVSRLVRHKGYRELLAAMAAVPEAELWVVGNRLATDRGEDLEPAFAAAGLGGRLKRLGYRADVPALLAAADVFCLPSYFEGLPMGIIEAMLTGLPVVATDIRGCREQVLPEQTGLLVPPMQVAPLAEALARLAADPALRARMGAAGRARAMAEYDEAKVLARTLDLLGA